MKIIIPRKDHEVYFIPIPEGLKSNMTQRFVYDKLNELHPDFSATTRVDIKTFKYNEAHWFMVTVIAGETLAEYQIIHRGAVLYTNTSILAHSESFTSTIPGNIDDELIGFDSEKKAPVSIPLETTSTSSSQRLAGKIRHIPPRCGVFNRKKPAWLFAAILVGIMVVILLPIAYASAKISGQENIPVIIEHHVEKSPELIFMPSAFVILVNIAELLLQANGEIDRWQFHDEGAVTSVIMQCNGISALTAHTIFNELEYMTLDDIQVVNYIDNNPVVNIALRAKLDIFSRPVSIVFPRQSTILSAADELTGLLNSQYITIISEILPSVDNGYELYTINYTAYEIDLIKSMEIIEELCERYSLLVRRLDITTSTGKNLFTVTCALSYNATPDNPYFIPNNKKHLIPLAFGYRPSVMNFTFSAMTESISERMSIIGTIRDSNGQIIYFHDTDGKINIRSGW